MRQKWLIVAVVGAFLAIVLAGVLLLALPAKVNDPATAKSDSAAPATAPATSTAATAPASTEGPPRVSVVVGPKGIDGLTAPDGARIEPVTGADGVAVVRLSGVNPQAPSNGRPGIYLPLPVAFEAAASGNTVRVTVTARAASGSPSPAFAVAYSTSEVGNSGWRPFKLSDQLTPYSFTYDVKKLKQGLGDYIGILPHPAGADGAVEISAISAEVLPPGTAP